LFSIKKEVVVYIGGKGGKGSELRKERLRRALKRTIEEGIRVRQENKTINCGDVVIVWEIESCAKYLEEIKRGYYLI
jgi:hypothetical protein